MMAACHCSDQVGVGMPDEVLSANQLKALVRHVVAAQGNGFIKELLRECDSRIGVTKENFIANLEVAIDEGTLTQARLGSTPFPRTV